MRKQQKIWSEEHNTAQALPTEMQTDSEAKPSSFVVQFYELLCERGVTSGKAVDIGAGKGRNSFFLADKGFEVSVLDYIQEAITFINSISKYRKLSDRIQTYCQPIDEKWPFEDNFFDVAVDSFASIDIETRSGREICRDEMFRTLKPGGYAMVTVVSADDEIESEMIQKNPGQEKNSTVWPQNGKFQKDYDEAELREFYKDFEIIELKKVSKKAHKLGRDFTATNFWLVLRKT